MNKRLIGMAAVASLFLASCAVGRGLVGGGGQAATPATIDVNAAAKYVVQKGTIETRVVANGKVIPRQNGIVAFQRAGQVITRSIQLGDIVRAGQMLAGQDTSDLELSARQQWYNYIGSQASFSQTVKAAEPRDIEAAKAALNSAQAAYAELAKGPSAGTVDQALHAWNQAKNALWSSQLSRDKICANPVTGKDGPDCKVADANVGSSYESERRAYQQYVDSQAATTDDKLAQAYSGIVAAKTKLDSLVNPNNSEAAIGAKAKLDQAYASWESADLAIKKASIYAPFDGVITTLNFDVGDWMSGGQKAIEVTAFERPLFEVDVDEADVANVRLGQDARVLLQSYSQSPISATVDYIAPAATTSGNIVTVKVRLALAQVGFGGGAGARQNFQPRAGQGISGTAPVSATVAAGAAPAQGAGGPGGRGPGGAGGPAAGAGITRTGQVPNIIIGMSGTSEIVASRIENALQVPNRALVANRATRGFGLWRLKADGTAELVTVRTGFRGQDTTQVLDGVNEGDTVLIPSTTAGAAGGGGGGGGPVIVGGPGGGGGGGAPPGAGR